MTQTHRAVLPALGLVLALVTSACSGGGDEPASSGADAGTSASPFEPATPPESPADAPSETPSETPAETPSETPTEPPAPPAPVSLPAYFSENRDYDGRDLRLGAVRERTADYTSYDVTWRGDGLRLSGVLNVPDGRGPFPALVLAHGYIDPDYYESGQGMTRERGYLAARGYVALHVDYRGHGTSDGTEQRNQRQVELGYVADVVNAAAALRRSRDVPVDDRRVGIMGRSMGGGVVLRALSAAPDVFHAGVPWASVSSLESENFRRWSDPEEQAYFDRVHGLPGTPRGRDFWAGVSARTYLDRIEVPVLAIHGRFDDTCPPRWAAATQRALTRAGVDASLQWYDDAHAFGPQFNRAMDDAIGFFEAAPPRRPPA